MAMYEELDEEIITAIKTFIANKWKEEELVNFYPNIILRSDILHILDRYCTVIYYPLENESNNGFHFSDIPAKNDEIFNFVFINTNQTIEKQVYTAAHELGHVWKIEEVICEKYGIDSKDKKSEMIVNRFAAELLMPENEFKEQFNIALENCKKEDGKVPFIDFIKLIAFLMNYFLAPMKAIMYRLIEIKVVSADTINLFISGDGNNLSEIVTQSINRIIRQEGYIELYKPTEKKLIDGLAEMLDMAEAQKTISIAKIRHMRERFELESTEIVSSAEQDVKYIKLEDGTSK